MVTILASMLGKSEPEEPNQISSGADEHTTVHVSVRPR
jgi:hypothetical protein